MEKDMIFLLFIVTGCILTALLLAVQWIMDDDEKGDKK